MLTMLFLVLFHGTPVALETADAAWTIERLMGRMAEVPSARARFTEIRQAALFDSPVTLTGTLVYERPAKIERTVLTPYEQRFLADGDTLVIENSRRKEKQTRTVRLSSQPLVRAFVESMRATLAGDQATLVQFYRLSLDGNETNWTLRLEPISRELAGHVSFIRISGIDKRIVTVEMQETDGARSTMTVTDEEPRSLP